MIWESHRIFYLNCWCVNIWRDHIYLHVTCFYQLFNFLQSSDSRYLTQTTLFCILIICISVMMIHKRALRHDSIRLAKCNTKPQFESANCKFIQEKNSQSSKDEMNVHIYENNVKGPQVWGTFVQTRLGGKFWACNIHAQDHWIYLVSHLTDTWT